MKSNKFIKIAVLSAVFSLIINKESFAANGLAGWLNQVGATNAILSSANWGKGQLIGVVDTGINPNSAVFAKGQVSSLLSKCSAVTFTCSKSFMDDNGHGTAVASIAAANITSPFNLYYAGYTTSVGDAISLASSSNLVAFKVLNANGTAYSTDVANGLKQAADSGASVINLSLTFGNTSDIVSAINYATSKGATIVWAGGNSATNLLNNATTVGLTADAIKKLIIVGSVNSSNVLSTFSNKAGSGYFLNTANVKTNYSDRWVVAPGEGILAPMTTVAPNAYGYYSGTSMAAPIVSASAALLQSEWPILKTNGTTANLLLATTKDLGSVGTDVVYGHGIIDLGKAFSPYGQLSVYDRNNVLIPVSQLTTSTISNGALGSLTAIQSKLSNYTSFDTYSRNFSVNLAGLIKSPKSSYALNPLPVNVKSAPVVMKFIDGSELTTLQYKEPEPAELIGLSDSSKIELMENQPIYALSESKSGEVFGIGKSYTMSYAYNKAFMGDDSNALMESDLNSSGLNSMADGGMFLVYGNKLSNGDRLATSFSQSKSQLNSSAYSFNVGYSTKIGKSTTIGLNGTILSQVDTLLGTKYSKNSFVGFGDNNQSKGLNLSLGEKLSNTTSILFDFGIAKTAGNEVTSGLVSRVGGITSTSYGVMLTSRDLFEKLDNLSLSIKQPLRASSGSAYIRSVSVDVDGNPLFTTDKVSLVPNGRQIDFKSSYSLQLSETQKFGFEASYVKDAGNLSGNDVASASANWTINF